MSLPERPASPDPVYLQPNYFVDSEHPAILAYVRAHAVGDSPRARAVSLYYAVRDDFRYNPWGGGLEPEDFVASRILARPPTRGAHCVDKALVLAACARAVGIPSRLHFADVRNHVGTARLERLLGTDLLVYHGYCELWLDGRFVAATPAFNRELCERLGVAPLEFDGVEDSVFQAYDRAVGKFMEYVTDRGTDPGVPVAEMVAAWRRHYPVLRDTQRWPQPDDMPGSRRGSADRTPDTP